MTVRRHSPRCCKWKLRAARVVEFFTRCSSSRNCETSSTLQESSSSEEAPPNMSDQLRDQVQDPHAHPDIDTARNLPDAADAEQSLEGYASVNGLSDQSEIARVAYRLYLEREREGRA